MPTLDENQRREQDLFSQERRDQEEQAAALAAKAKAEAEQRAQAQAQKKEQLERKQESQVTAPVMAPFEKEAVAPHMLAELPQQTEAPRETLVRLFEHYTESGGGGDEALDTNTVAQADPRQGARDLLPRTVEVGDSIRDGMAADFVHDSAIVAGELDTHPGSPGQVDQADGWSERRRRQGTAAPESVEPVATSLAQQSPSAEKEQA